MAEEKNLVIDRIENILDEEGNIIGKAVFDKDNNSVKVKGGPGGHLKEKWEQLDVGKCYKFTMGMFTPAGKTTAYPFVRDFELVKDIFIKQAIEKVSDKRSDSIEQQAALKSAVELLVAKVIELQHPLAKSAIAWALGRLGSEAIITSQPVEISKEGQVQVKLPVPTPENVITPESVIAELKVLLAKGTWTKEGMVKRLHGLGAIGIKTIDMVKSLPEDKLAAFDKEIKEALKVKP